MADPKKHLVQTGWIHLAFSVGSKEKVDALAARLKADGYEVISGPRTTGDGYYESAAIRKYKKLGFQPTETVDNHSWSTKGETVYEVKM